VSDNEVYPNAITIESMAKRIEEGEAITESQKKALHDAAWKLIDAIEGRDD
jgi:hypothetical protein